MVISLVVMMQFFKEEFKFYSNLYTSSINYGKNENIQEKLASLRMTFQNYQMSMQLCVKV